MKRRTFVFSGAAALALPVQALAQRSSRNAQTSFETELTGSVIELGDSGFTFGETGVENDSESVEVVKGTAAGYIDFVPTIDDPEEFMESSIDEIQAQVSNAEVVETGTFDDGAWALMHADLGGVSTALYREVQLGAYPQYDLVISFRCAVDEFEDTINAFQSVTVDTFAPFLFMEDSDVVALAAAIVPVSTTTTSSRSSRTTRGSSSNTTTTTEDDTYREDVRAHRTEFQESFLVFAQSLATLTDTTSSSAATQTALGAIDAVADEWLLYPDRASELTAPDSEGALAALYEAWCDEIATMAEIWLDAREGNASADEILAQLDVMIDADDALGAELDAAATVILRPIALRSSTLVRV